jgi:hypothetical protein
MNKGLGRIMAIDSRDASHQLRSLLATVHVEPRTKYWPTGAILDQGDKPHCVGYAWCQFIQSAPLMTRRRVDPIALYRDAQRVDEWPGENYAGTSVRAGAKVLQRMQAINEYAWANDAATVRDFLLTRGTVIVGTDWFEGMFTVKDNGFIDATGPIVGGHAYLLSGYSVQRNAFRIVNSWGREWGHLGRAWIDFDLMNSLIANYGEACSAIEAK